MIRLARCGASGVRARQSIISTSLSTPAPMACSACCFRCGRGTIRLGDLIVGESLSITDGYFQHKRSHGLLRRLRCQRIERNGTGASCTPAPYRPDPAAVMLVSSTYQLEKTYPCSSAKGYTVPARSWSLVIRSRTGLGSQCLATTRSTWAPKLMTSKWIRKPGVGSYSVVVAIHAADNHLSRNYEWVGSIQVFNVVNSSQSTFVGFFRMPPAVECN